MAERGVESLFGGSKRAGWSCSLVTSTVGEPSRSFHGEGPCPSRPIRNWCGGSPWGMGTFAARRNHDLLTDGESSSALLSSITAPTLVIHGTAPMFSVARGEALADELPDGAPRCEITEAGRRRSRDRPCRPRHDRRRDYRPQRRS